MTPQGALRLADIPQIGALSECFRTRYRSTTSGILPWPRRTRPYLYTNAEVLKFMSAALDLRPAHGLRHWTYHCLFGLLAVTGMRISEALALQRRR